MNQRIKENLSIRFKNLSRELRVRNRSRIDKRKYYGVKKNITDYQKLILDTLYDEDLIKQEVLSKESLSDYFSILNDRMLNIVDKIREIILDTAKKGSKRVQTTNGDTIKFEEIKDQGSIDLLANQQLDYLKNITKAQQDIIRKTLIEGQEKGLSIDEISNTMSSKVKNLTKTRAQTIARSEIVKTSNLAQVNTMKQLGAEKYIYWTANDKKVCKTCRKLQGNRNSPNVYKISEIGKSAPLPIVNSHPQCRCVILIAD